MSASVIQRQQELWKKYSETKDQGIKEQLIIEYADLVKYVAGRLSIYFGSNVEYDDLVGYGVFGLIDAIDKFSLQPGKLFCKLDFHFLFQRLKNRLVTFALGKRQRR